jgi:malate dehydrogenase (quinone)
MQGNSMIANPNIVLIGAGIMSATLGVLLKELEPGVSIQIFETLDDVALESSDAWNNAGTGHAALCELNYTPQRSDGSIDISKAIKVNESFKISMQFWAYLIEQKLLDLPSEFIRRVPHMSFVSGAKDVEFLRKRYEKMKGMHLFEGMEFSEDPKKLAEWMPLVMEGRDVSQPLAATYSEDGTDVNFGSLTRNLFNYLKGLGGVTIHLNHEVRNLTRKASGSWMLEITDKASGRERYLDANFVFLGAGGGALPLLQKSRIPKGDGYGGFPVSGQWLRCTNPELIEQHQAKVYGKASVGAPPMSVPHLDTRMIDGEKGLLFGPFAGFTTKYLKNGSIFDFALSIQPGNLLPMTAAGLQNIPLTSYLIGQVLQSATERLDALREFIPKARMGDWKLETAGQRVQIIKKDPKKGGILEFGTEIICADDGSLAALLGASPGASTSVAIMLGLLNECFPDEVKSPAWQTKLHQMIPSYGKSLAKDPNLHKEITEWSQGILKLEVVGEESLLQT